MQQRKTWALALAFIGVMAWFFPGWNGFFFEASNVSAGEGEIVGAIFIVGALMLWFSSKA